jgi:hypothetical protein
MQRSAAHPDVMDDGSSVGQRPQHGRIRRPAMSPPWDRDLVSDAGRVAHNVEHVAASAPASLQRFEHVEDERTGHERHPLRTVGNA